jgi:hypothetical protein
MEVVKTIRFSDDDRRVFREAALAKYVGDPHYVRELGPLHHAVRDPSPMPLSRLQLLHELLADIEEAVTREADPAYWRAITESAETTVAVANPPAVAEVIMEARRKMLADIITAVGRVRRAMVLCESSTDRAA